MPSENRIDHTDDKVAILIAAAAIVAPRLHELRDTPALRCAIHDAIRVAEYMIRVIDSRLAEAKLQ
jgi:hypothetical protein